MKTIRAIVGAVAAMSLMAGAVMAQQAGADKSPAKFKGPLKVFILAGQSNMEGHAAISTFDYIGKDPLTAPMLKEMRNPDGTPRVCDKVWMSYLTGPYDGSANGEGLGKLTAGFGARGDQPAQKGGNIGPEFTFGIYMEKALKQPILIIKTAWGGRSLNTEFRPPSAGPYKLPKEIQEVWDQHPQGAHGVPKLEDRKKWQDEKNAATGVFYRMMIEHVKKVLADPKRVCPEYDEKAGYELAGFVWLQGFNDLVDGQTYPNGNYDEYSRLLSHFIRDVRKDLLAPKMPFVIGVLGVGGKSENNIFRKAMAAPADMPGFKGNVLAVDTAPFWDYAIAAAEPKQGEYNNIVATAHTLKNDGKLDRKWKWENYWKPIGKTLPEERIWRFVTMDATEKKDKLETYDARRFRDITLPAGMENWYMPDFDDRKWTAGKAPIGKGVWDHSGIKLDKFPSTWGKGEFLLMRTTFEVEDLNCDSYRLAVLARQGFRVYLNGQEIHTYIWWADKPQYGSIVLTEDQIKHLKKGKNVLAVYANDQYDLESPEHYAAIDVRIEGITKADQKKLNLALEEVLSPKDREALKGASNGGYHYFGSAKIFAQMGKAFAEALLPLQNEPTRPERPWPVAVELADVRMTGELSKRLTASFDRLEEGFYSPPGLYDSPNQGWPGDKEGRTLLGLVLLEQVTGRPAKHLEASLDMYSRRVNARGYLGPVMVPDAIHEQTLGGQFWVLNALYEYEASKKNGRVNAWADQILNNIYLASADAYPRYPITPAERKTQSFQLADGRTGKWDLAPQDIGCGMAGSLDALTDAYRRHPSKETGRVLDTVIKRWMEIDLEAIHAQLHSTLISTRSLLRHFETTGRKELLQVATDRYRLYRAKAMSDNFENHNWFGRPEWTEGCAVVDSFIIAVQLWRYTGEATYLEDAHRIYYNGLSVNQRSNGGLGCNSCPSVDKPFLTVVSQEATQCCTMRGADGLTKAAQYCFFKSDAGVIVPFYQDARATLRWGEQSLTLLQKTGYPWQGDVRLEVTAAQGDEPRTLNLFTPSWAERPVLKLNGQVLSVTRQGGFLNVSRRWQAGDVVELSFEQSVAAKAPVNRVNGADRGEYRTFHYGPLMLGYTGPKAVSVKPDARFSRRGERDFLVDGTDLVLQPIYHLLDPAVSKNRGYQRQIIFP